MLVCMVWLKLDWLRVYSPYIVWIYMAVFALINVSAIIIMLGIHYSGAKSELSIDLVTYLKSTQTLEVVLGEIFGIALFSLALFVAQFYKPLYFYMLANFAAITIRLLCEFKVPSPK